MNNIRNSIWLYHLDYIISIHPQHTCQTKWKGNQLTFFCFMPYNPFQIHTCPRFTRSKAFRFRYYSNITSVHTHWTSPYQKLLNWGCNVVWRRGKVGRQNLRCKTTGNRRRRCRHCKERVNLEGKTKKGRSVMLKVLEVERMLLDIHLRYWFQMGK